MERERTTAELPASPGSWTRGQVDLRVEVINMIDVVTGQFDMTMLGCEY